MTGKVQVGVNMLVARVAHAAVEGSAFIYTKEGPSRVATTAEDPARKSEHAKHAELHTKFNVFRVPGVHALAQLGYPMGLGPKEDYINRASVWDGLLCGSLCCGTCWQQQAGISLKSYLLIIKSAETSADSSLHIAIARTML